MSNEQLVLRIQAGEDVAANGEALYLQNKGLIYAVAKRYTGYGELEDLTQEGYFGFHKAVWRFDPAAGASFSAYAVLWIRQAIQRYLHNRADAIRIPVHRQEQIRRYHKAVSEYQALYGADPSDEEIRRQMGVGREAFPRIRLAALMTRPASLDAPLSDEGDACLRDTIADAGDRTEDVIEGVANAQLREELWAEVDALEPSLAALIRGRYQERRTLRALGGELGVSNTLVKVRERKALVLLRRRWKVKQLAEAYEIAWSKAYHGSGIQSFQRTWTSSTERAAMALAEGPEWLREIRNPS
jgi:RNA polymerase primary sigma factor